MPRDSLPRAAKEKPAAVVEDSSSDSDSEDSGDGWSPESATAKRGTRHIATAPANEARAVSEEIQRPLTASEVLRRIVEQLPRETLNELVIAATEAGRPITQPELEHGLNTILRQSILQLPVEILASILATLPVRDRILVSRTCRLLRNLVETEPSIWRTVVVVKVPFNRKERNPNSWITRATIPKIMARIPERSVRTFTGDSVMVTKTILRSVVESHDVTELNLIGPHFASGWLLPSGLTFPYLNSLRAWSPGRASNQFIRETMLDTLDSNAGITTVCFDCQRFVVDFVRDTGHRIFKDRLTKLELSGTASISDVDLIIGEFKALNDLVLKNVAYRRLSDEDRIPIFDTIMHAGDAENAPRFAHMTLSEQARDSRASRASLKIIQIQRLETDRYIDTEWIAGSTLSLLFEICGSGVEHVVIRGMRGTFLPLYGSYPHLRTLELDQSFEIDENHRSWQDVDPIMSCFAGHRPGGVDAIFHGFSAPELERVVIHGEGTLREKNIRPFLPNTDVDICITGKDRGAFAHYDVDWTKMM